MRPNNSYNPANYAVDENLFWREHIESFFFKILAHSPEINENKLHYTDDGFIYELNDKEVEFYTQHYVHIGEIIQKTSFSKIYRYFSQDLIISTREKELFDFLFEIPQRKLVFLGKVGWGKTTLIKYFFFYMLQKSDSLKKIVQPIYICLHKEMGRYANSGDIEKYRTFFFNDILEPRIFKLCETVIEIDNEAFWNYLINFSDFSKLKRKTKEYNRIYKDNIKKKDKKTFLLRSKYIDEEPKVLYYALKFLVEIHKKSPVIIIDDLDLIPIKYNKIILEELHRLTQKYSIKIIFSARPNTYYGVFKKYTRLAQVINPVKLELKIPHLLPYLSSRKNLVEKYKHKNEGTLINIFDENIKFTKGIDFMLQMINSAMKEHNQNFISAISSGDIRKFARMLRVYFSSDFINYDDLFKKYIKGKLRQDIIPDWLLYIPIITNNYRLYFSSKKASVLSEEFVNNIFNNNDHSNSNFLIKIHILSYLNHEDHSVKFKKFRNDYQYFYRQNQRDEVKESFNQAMISLINSRLVNSEEFFTIDSPEMLEEIDEIIIEPTGRYYIEHLIFNFEYIVYMKDDVDYDEDIDIIDCTKTRGFTKRFTSTSKFLEYFFIKESDFLKKLNKKRLFLYKTNYALNLNTFFFSLPITEQIKNFGEMKSLSTINLQQYRDLIEVIKNQNKYYHEQSLKI